MFLNLWKYILLPRFSDYEALHKDWELAPRNEGFGYNVGYSLPHAPCAMKTEGFKTKVLL
jgi:hypothetical protein